MTSSIHKNHEDSWHGEITAGSEKGRYHLYIGLFCPFAHRANLVRHLKGLTDIIDISVVHPYPLGDSKGWPGWKFPENEEEYPAATTDKLFGSRYLHEVYFKADKDYNGRYSVPVLWDGKNNTIVNNESAEILRSLQTSFNDILSPDMAKITLYPEHLRTQIDSIAEWMQRDLNSGVYKAGFAQSQAEYDKYIVPVFGALNKLEQVVYQHGGPYILGNELTELDVRAYATLIRFDVIYVQHFKCNLGMIRHDYPVLHEWLKNLYHNVKGFKETTNFKHIKDNYTKSQADINPHGITPMGPYPNIDDGVELDFSKLKPGAVQLPAVLEYQNRL